MPYEFSRCISTQSRVAQIIATALAAVFNDRIQILDYLPGPHDDEPWDNNDTAIVRSAIDRGSFDVESLKWKAPGPYEDGTNYIRCFVLPALTSYFKATKDKALFALKDGENADDVLGFLGIDNEAHPKFECFL